MKSAYPTIVLLLLAVPVQADQPTFFCGLIGSPADSGYRITASNPIQSPVDDVDLNRSWSCTVTCVVRTSDDREFTSLTCTERARLGADDDEICRDGPGLAGFPFSSPAISTSSCN